MSARLKLKNLKKRIKFIEERELEAELKYNSAEKLVRDNIQQIFVDYQLPYVETLRDEIGVVDIVIDNACYEISKRYAEGLAEYVKHKLYEMRMLHRLGRVRICLSAPKLNEAHVKLEPLCSHTYI